jgi:hypothetical protein
MRDKLSGPHYHLLYWWIRLSGLGGKVPRPLVRGTQRFESWMEHHYSDPDLGITSGSTKINS